MVILAAAIAYILGAIPFGYLLVKWKTGGDVRASGSGNIGATNVLRATGRAAGVATLLLDIGKGYLAVWIAGRITGGSAACQSLAALAVMAGHAYPVFLKFKGGKAVASFVGAFLCLTPVALGAVLVVFTVVVAWTRHISMGSIVGAATIDGIDCGRGHVSTGGVADSEAGTGGRGGEPARGGFHYLQA